MGENLATIEKSSILLIITIIITIITIIVTV
jgi:hypothetical protein